MAARVIWKGSISFGLVHIPVALYSGEQRNEMNLSMLDRRDASPVGYKRINKNTEKEVPWEHVVKGYEYDKGEYVILEAEDFEKANVKATQTVEIFGFVDRSEIPFTYYTRPYYTEPINKGEKVYALLRETLKASGKLGLAKVVLRQREHLAALAAQDDMLTLELLRFHYELRQPTEFKVPGSDLSALGIGKKELEMAQRLVEDMSIEWSPEQYEDEYRNDLLALIEEKLSKGTVKSEGGGKPKQPKSAEVIDLMALLKRSVEEQGKEGSGKRSSGTAKKTSKKKSSAKKKTTSGGGKKRASR